MSRRTVGKRLPRKIYVPLCYLRKERVRTAVEVLRLSDFRRNDTKNLHKLLRILSLSAANTAEKHQKIPHSRNSSTADS